jgi:Flp pilus assembly protein TadG
MLVQFALVFPIALLLIGAIFDFTQFMYTYSTVSLAVTRTARCAAISYNMTDGTYSSQCPDYDQYLRNTALGVNTTRMTNAANQSSPFTVFDVAGCNPGAKTTVKYTYTFIFPNPLDNFRRISIPVTESACMTRIQ